MKSNKLKALFACAAVCALGSAAANAAATIIIVNNNAAGVGFNDPTPAAPVGGNTGTTIGQQRLIAFSAAAAQWGATITSTQTIRVRAQFTPLSCNATGAVLGSAGATQVFSSPDPTDFPRVDTWYPVALADKLVSFDIDPATPEINANFNSNLGSTNCLTGTFFYYGLDNNHGTNVDLYTVLLHELGHGLGFQTFTNGSSGAQLGAPFLPSIWDWFLQDNSTGKFWAQMTNAERAASAIAVNHLVWTGANVSANAPIVLQGTPQLVVAGPAAGAATGTYLLGAASFGPPLNNTGVTGDIMPVTAAGGLACAPLTGADALAVNGNIALVVRGTCNFNVKVANAQAAGAKGVIVQDNVAGSPPPGIGGTDPTVTIPSGRVTLADGNTIRAALVKRSRTKSGVVATLGLNAALLSGTDPAGRVLMYTPNPFASGSSVSHFDVSAFPNVLMEPNINGDLLHSVIPPQDLTFPLLLDIGW